MKITVTIARILLGLVFFAAGLSGFLLIAHPPAPPPGLAGQFQDVFFRSYWVLFVDGVELIAGIFLLSNRYVPLAVVLLGAVIANIIVFHVAPALQQKLVEQPPQPHLRQQLADEVGVEVGVAVSH